MAQTVASNWRIADAATLNYCKTVAGAIKERHAELINVGGIHSLHKGGVTPKQVKKTTKSKVKGRAGNQHSNLMPLNTIAIQLKDLPIVHSPKTHVPLPPVQNTTCAYGREDMGFNEAIFPSNKCVTRAQDIMPEDWHNEETIGFFKTAKTLKSLDDGRKDMKCKELSFSSTDCVPRAQDIVPADWHNAEICEKTAYDFEWIQLLKSFDDE